MGRRQDLAGRTFGRWEVLEMIREPDQHPMCRARCGLCGEVKVVRAAHLTTGKSHSCCGVRHNLRGQRFGDLLVLRRASNLGPSTPAHPTGRTAWRCRCERCGREVIVGTHRLLAPVAPKTHCGCGYLLPAAPLEPLDSIDASAAAPVLHTTSAQAALDREADALRPFAVAASSRLRVDEDFNDGRALVLDDCPNHEDNP